MAIGEWKSMAQGIYYHLDRTNPKWRLLMTEFRKKLCLTNQSSQILTVLLYGNKSE